MDSITCRPYVIYLTFAQEKELREYFKEIGWQIGVFKRIHQSFHFLVDLIIQDEKLALGTLRKYQEQYKGNRPAGKKQNAENKEAKGTTCNVHFSDITEDTGRNAGYYGKKSVYNRDKLEADNWSNEVVVETAAVQNNTEDVKSEDAFFRSFEERKSTDISPNESMHHGQLTEEEFVEKMTHVKVDAATEQENNSEVSDHSAKGKTWKLRSTGRANGRKKSFRNKLKCLATIAERRKYFKCGICGKVAASEHNFKRHSDKLHSEEALMEKTKKSKQKPHEVFACTICRKQFADKYALNTHHLNMHGEKKAFFQCDICGAVLKHLGNLVQHKKSLHSDTRSHTCDICGSKFKLHQHLKTHKRRHDPDFVETCTICGKTLRKGHLSTHMKRHSNDRNFKCDKCGKTFYAKQDLERHIILHSGEKPNKCPYCTYACAFKGNLTKHINAKHQGEPNTSFQQSCKKKTNSYRNEESKVIQSELTCRKNFDQSTIKTPSNTSKLPSSLRSYVLIDQNRYNNTGNGNRLYRGAIDNVDIDEHVYTNAVRTVSATDTPALSVIDSHGEQFLPDTKV